MYGDCMVDQPFPLPSTTSFSRHQKEEGNSSLTGDRISAILELPVSDGDRRSVSSHMGCLLTYRPNVLRNEGKQEPGFLFWHTKFTGHLTVQDLLIQRNYSPL